MLGIRALRLIANQPVTYPNICLGGPSVAPAVGGVKSAGGGSDMSGLDAEGVCQEAVFISGSAPRWDRCRLIIEPLSH